MQSVKVGDQLYTPEPTYINHISNFKASKDELQRVKELTKDKPLPPVQLEHIKKISKKLYKDIKQLVEVKYKDNFATHVSHRRLIPNREFKIDLVDEAKDRTIFKRQYPINGDKRLVLIHHAKLNVKNGMFIKNYTSKHNVPIIVINTHGRMRLAYDLTKLNQFTKSVESHIPTYNYLHELLRGPGKWTVTDIKNFFECINLREKDRDLVHVTTPIGQFNVTCGTYGFKNISALAQDISNDLVRPLRKAGAFIDDIFIKHRPNATPEELKRDVEELFGQVGLLQVLLNPAKTFFFVDEIRYIGYYYNQIGSTPTEEYKKKVLKFHRPLSAPQIKSYNGVVQYIQKYLYKYAEWAYYLNILTHTHTKAQWGPEQDFAFDQIQELVRNVKLLHHPTEEGTFLVQCDASKYAISGVLYQRQYDSNLKTYVWRIIEFYSKQLEQSVIDKHSIQVKELLAVAYSVVHWQHFLLRKLFYVDTDHKNLISLYDPDPTKAPKMKSLQIIQTILWILSPYNFKIAHIKGGLNILADYLSRDGSIHNHIDLEIEDPQFEDSQQQQQFITVISQMENIRSQVKGTDYNNHFTNFQLNLISSIQSEYDSDYGPTNPTSNTFQWYPDEPTPKTLVIEESKATPAKGPKTVSWNHNLIQPKSQPTLTTSSKVQSKAFFPTIILLNLWEIL